MEQFYKTLQLYWEYMQKIVTAHPTAAELPDIIIKIIYYKD